TLIKTDGEFHSIRRQLDRLGEAGLTIVTLPAHPVDTLADRLARAIDDRVACVLVSTVLFETAEIVAGLGLVSRPAARHCASLPRSARRIAARRRVPSSECRPVRHPRHGPRNGVRHGRRLQILSAW